jgi:hypothetical protein
MLLGPRKSLLRDTTAVSALFRKLVGLKYVRKFQASLEPAGMANPVFSCHCRTAHSLVQRKLGFQSVASDVS